MRRTFIIALGLVSLGALAAAQPASAGVTCQDVCVWRTYSNGSWMCTKTIKKCMHTSQDTQTPQGTGYGSQAPQTINQLKNKKAF